MARDAAAARRLNRGYDRSPASEDNDSRQGTLIRNASRLDDGRRYASGRTGTVLRWNSATLGFFARATRSHGACPKQHSVARGRPGRLPASGMGRCRGTLEQD